MASKASKLFHREAGEVSFSDFYKLKYQYIVYKISFIIKTIISFLGYQLVTNNPIYVILRKFLTQCIYNVTLRKKISNINILIVILLIF
jgi:hypothetical protein